jgi:hypothetical protein
MPNLFLQSINFHCLFSAMIGIARAALQAAEKGSDVILVEKLSTQLSRDQLENRVSLKTSIKRPILALGANFDPRGEVIPRG